MLCSTTRYSGRVKLGSFMSQSCKQQLRNEQKCAMHVQSCFFCQTKPVKGLNPEVISKVGWVWSSGWTFNVVLNNLLLFCCCKNSLLLWSRNFATKVTWRHTSPLYWAYFYLSSNPGRPTTRVFKELVKSGWLWFKTLPQFRWSRLALSPSSFFISVNRTGRKRTYRHYCSKRVREVFPVVPSIFHASRIIHIMGWVTISS